MRVGKWIFGWHFDWRTGGFGPRWDITPGDGYGPTMWWLGFDLGPLLLKATNY